MATRPTLPRHKLFCEKRVKPTKYFVSLQSFRSDCRAGDGRIAPCNRGENLATTKWWQKLKTSLEWVRLGKFVFDTIILIFSQSVIKSFFHTYIPQIPHDLATGVAWVLAAIIFLWLLEKHSKSAALQQLQTEQSTNQGPTSALIGNSGSTPNFDATTFFKMAYVSSTDPEIQANVRRAADVNSPGDHESFYVRLISIGLIGYRYDIIWAYIYRSQLLALMEVNRRMMPMVELKPFYERAIQENPQHYANYPFEHWIIFLKTHLLILVHPSEMVEITVQGKDFLKYLTHCGRHPDDRKL
jgi:hypothetical protein